MTFEEYCEDLDCTIIGITALNPDTQMTHGLDGAIVICDSVDLMEAWIKEHEVPGPVEFELAYYGEIIECVSKDGTSYHMDAETTTDFRSILSKDPRFRPEVLHIEDDGWALITSSFNPSADPPTELMEEMEQFVIGFAPNDTENLRVHGAPQAGTTAFSFEDLHDFDIPLDCLDEWAMGKVRSVWDWFQWFDEDESA